MFFSKFPVGCPCLWGREWQLDREWGVWRLNLKYFDAPLRGLMWAGLIHTVSTINMCGLVGSQRKSSRTFRYKMFCLICNDRFCATVEIHVGLLGCSGWPLLKFKILTVQGTCFLTYFICLFIFILSEQQCLLTMVWPSPKPGLNFWWPSPFWLHKI